MSETTAPLAVPNSKETSLGSPARTAYLLVAGAALVAGLVGRPVGQTAPQAVLPEAPVGQYRAVEAVAPVAAPVANAVVTIEGLAPVVASEMIAPAQPARVASAPVALAPVPSARIAWVRFGSALDDVSDRDDWSRDPALQAA